MKLTLVLPIAVCLLGVTACEKNTVDPAGPLQATSSLNTGTTPTPECDVISFNNETAGSYVTQVESDGGIAVAVTSSNETGSNAARIFNSTTAASSPDPDLYSASLGNILISQDRGATVPNDYAGGAAFTFDFAGTITATSLTCIDIEEAGGSIVLRTDQGGTQIGSTIAIPTTPNGETQDVSLGNTSGVGYIEVYFKGSGGLDNLVFCPEVRQPHCNYTQGYWKNHEEAWPVSSLLISGVTYNQAELLTILKTPVKGNGLISLLHQLIAAKLNIALDGGDASIITTIAQAEVLIVGRKLPGDYLSPSATSQLTGQLDAFNNSDHCD